MALKPMNCPAHILIFRQGIKSYRDLPIRLAEFGCCHRNEPHGALHGILRVRQFTQDDAHIFCREDQIVEETRAFCDLLDSIYKDLGFSDYAIKLALRPEKRHGTDETWDKAEQDLRDAVRLAGRDGPEYQWEELPGEGAFYSPEARIPPQRRDRPDLAVRHAPARLCDARPARRLLHRRGRREACAGDAAPRDHRHVRALPRHIDRASCRPLPALAGAGAGGGRDDRLRRRRLCPRGRGARSRRRGFASSSTSATRRSTTRCASTASPTSPICSSSASARPRSGRSRFARSAPTPGRRWWRSTRWSSGSSPRRCRPTARLRWRGVVKPGCEISRERTGAPRPPAPSPPAPYAAIVLARRLYRGRRPRPLPRRGRRRSLAPRLRRPSGPFRREAAPTSSTSTCRRPPGAGAGRLRRSRRSRPGRRDQSFGGRLPAARAVRSERRLRLPTGPICSPPSSRRPAPSGCPTGPRRIGLAPSSVSRGFRLAYGVSPQRYRARAAGAARRRASARRRTAGWPRSPPQAGFADQSHMTRAGRDAPSDARRAGCAPMSTAFKTGTRAHAIDRPDEPTRAFLAAACAATLIPFAARLGRGRGAAATRWVVRGSEGFDALSFLGPLSGDPVLSRTLSRGARSPPSRRACRRRRWRSCAL